MSILKRSSISLKEQTGPTIREFELKSETPCLTIDNLGVSGGEKSRSGPFSLLGIR